VLTGQVINEISNFVEEKFRGEEEREKTNFCCDLLIPNVLLSLIINDKIDKDKIRDKDYIFLN
jgi:hypothetical protein